MDLCVSLNAEYKFAMDRRLFSAFQHNFNVMNETFTIPLFNLVNCLSDAIDLVNPDIIEHHKKVAYVSLRMAYQLELSEKEKHNLFLAALLHDIGAVACNSSDNDQLLFFDIDNPHYHSMVGYFLLKQFNVFSCAAEAVRGHHIAWENGKGESFKNAPIPFISHIIHLADRIDILIDININILDQAETVRNKIAKNSGSKFHPDCVEAFMAVSNNEAFWLDLDSPYIKEIVSRLDFLPTIDNNIDDILNIAILISHIIDFRSSFTATHSSGVAATAQQLAQLMGLPDKEIMFIKIAGYLHDIGKLSVPKEILEKPGDLTPNEFNVIKKHAYHTQQVLNNVEFFKTVGFWAASHHERLDGAGYPFHFDQDSLDVNSRIIAVADLFTALSENRPYRKGMDKPDVMAILKKNVENRLIDSDVVALLIAHYEEIDAHRMKVQSEATENYQVFWDTVNQSLD